MVFEFAGFLVDSVFIFIVSLFHASVSLFAGLMHSYLAKDSPCLHETSVGAWEIIHGLMADVGQ